MCTVCISLDFLNNTAQLRVDQVLWDTLAGELQTRPTFNEMGLQQPRGPSFIATLTAEFHDYSELYAALDNIEKKKRRATSAKGIF